MLHGHWLKTLGIPGSYERVDVPLESVEAFFQSFHAQGFVGCNVTAPDKEAVLRAVTRLEPQAAMIGAVNTIWTENGSLVGGNTDVHGFIANLDDRAPGWDATAKAALLLGAGGATRAAIVALRARGLSVTLANRTRANAEALATHFNTLPGPKINVTDWSALPDALAKTDLLVNATVLGMLGKPPLDIDLAPLPATAPSHPRSSARPAAAACAPSTASACCSTRPSPASPAGSASPQKSPPNSATSSSKISNRRPPDR